ncbi:MAG: hypothetical protein JNL87_07285 [Burkholderiaceae bacterium]|nr:hypothetical protein [Burkholderiaceae bacterium]
MTTPSRSAVYFIALEELIVRSAEKEVFRRRAYSGGARTTPGNRTGKNAPEKLAVAYSKGSHHDRSILSFNPDRATIDPDYKGKGTARQAGGPIPPGRWTITDYDPSRKSKGALTLMPDASVRALHGSRDFDGYPFLIHATGKWGSWGCITLQSSDLIRLFEALGCTVGTASKGLNIPLSVYFHPAADGFAEYLDRLATSA